MFLKAQLQWNVIIPAEKIDPDQGLALRKAIAVRLMADFASKRVTSELGHFIAITTLDNIGEGRVIQHSGAVLFPVTFSCLTYRVFEGEVLVGEVHKIEHRRDLILRCGPVERIIISKNHMGGYSLVPGEKLTFMSEKSAAKIEIGVKLRFMVINPQYLEAEQEFRVIAHIDGDYLGPI